MERYCNTVVPNLFKDGYYYCFINRFFLDNLLMCFNKKRQVFLMSHANQERNSVCKHQ